MTHPISVQICLHKPLFSKKNCAQWKIRIPFCNCLKKERFQYIETFIMISLFGVPKQKKNSWWSKPVLMGVELFSYANISFVATNVHSYWPGE